MNGSGARSQSGRGLAVPACTGPDHPGRRLNDDTASVEQLTTLPGVGPKLAARIVEYRQKSGTFRSTQELINVKGVGEKNFAKIEAWLSVGEAPKAAAK